MRKRKGRLSPDYWRTRAEEIRALAESVSRPELKKTLLRTARDYDAIANIVGLIRLGRAKATISDVK
jgi:hypothetical protein